MEVVGVYSTGKSLVFKQKELNNKQRIKSCDYFGNQKCAIATSGVACAAPDAAPNVSCAGSGWTARTRC